MRQGLLPSLVAAVLIVATLFPVQVFGAPSPQDAGVSIPDREPIAHIEVCTSAGIGYARCHAQLRTDNRVKGKTPSRGAMPAVAGTLGNGGAYDPLYLQSAYNIASAASTAGHGHTVAIVDAYDAPTAEADLNFYRSYWGLSACTTGNGCFRKLNQTGAAGPYPAADASWSQETSLDIDMVSAMCPNCNILLVEANSSNFADLGAAVNTAAGFSPVAINNSYGSGEWNGETGYWESFYNHPGIAVTASAGDGGYGVEFPAASAYTIAVGGTTLNQVTNTGSRNATETVWSGTGSGCSVYVPKPAWQHDAGCPRRTVADIAAVADPATGVWVYDTTAFGGASGWIVIGGTSVAAPIISSMYALAASASVQYASGLFVPGASLFDVSAGTNGSCGGMYLCTGEVGYDGPTGNGTPNNVTAFGAAGAATATSTPTSTATATQTSTSTARATATRTPTATLTSSPVPTNTPTPTNTPPPTKTAIPTRTPTRTSTPAPTTKPTQTPQASYSSRATTSPTSVARGSSISITASVTSATASIALVDVEIYDATWHKVYQQFWDNQSLPAGQPRTFNPNWLVPTTAAPGTYTVMIGIFKPGWAAVYNWNNAAGVFTVR